MNMSKLRGAYRVNKYSTKNRVDANGNPIEFRLTFEEWLQIWIDSGHLHERGKRKGQYCMSRKDDLGHYEVGNVYIQLTSQNSSDAHKRPEIKEKHRKVALRLDVIEKKRSSLAKTKNRPEVIEKISSSKSKPCTVDGVTVYPSRKALVAELGRGPLGDGNPNFRYLEKDNDL